MRSLIERFHHARCSRVQCASIVAGVMPATLLAASLFTGMLWAPTAIAANDPSAAGSVIVNTTKTPAPAEAAAEAPPAVAEPPAVAMGPDGVPVGASAPPSPEAGSPAPEPVAEPDEQVEDTDGSALEDFEPHLREYGTWVEDPAYGTIWVPNRGAVGTRFAPYVTRGRWALTPTNDWIWVSDYPFGWVVFHYGRWVWSNGYGWSWVPGRRYAHAWVTFRVSDDPFIGWAPMPPTYVWRGGVAISLGVLPAAAFVFAPIDYAFYPSVQSYVIYENFRVNRLMSRSRYYAPPVRRVGYYYSPPVQRIPPQARPQGRVAPDSRSLELRQTRASGTAFTPAVQRGAGPHGAVPQQGNKQRNTVEPRGAAPRRVVPGTHAVPGAHVVPESHGGSSGKTRSLAPAQSGPQRDVPAPRGAFTPAPSRSNAPPPSVFRPAKPLSNKPDAGGNTLQRGNQVNTVTTKPAQPYSVHSAPPGGVVNAPAVPHAAPVRPVPPVREAPPPERAPAAASQDRRRPVAQAPAPPAAKAPERAPARPAEKAPERSQPKRASTPEPKRTAPPPAREQRSTERPSRDRSSKGSSNRPQHGASHGKRQ